MSELIKKYLNELKWLCNIEGNKNWNDRLRTDLGIKTRQIKKNRH